MGGGGGVTLATLNVVYVMLYAWDLLVYYVSTLFAFVCAYVCVCAHACACLALRARVGEWMSE